MVRRIRSCAALTVAGFCGWSVSASAAESFDYNDFASLSDLVLVGDAHQNGDELRLFDAEYDVIGSLWYHDRVHVGQFNTSFSFRTSDIDHWGGADGIGFIIQQHGNGLATWEFGPSGVNAVAIEFDFYHNVWESSDNAVQIWLDGMNAFDLGPAYHEVHLDGLGIHMKDQEVHRVDIAFDGSLLDVSIDSIAVVQDLPFSLGTAMGGDGKAWVGFGGRTGAAWLALDLQDWEFNSIPAPGSGALLGLAGLVLARRRRA